MRSFTTRSLTTISLTAFSCFMLACYNNSPKGVGLPPAGQVKQKGGSTETLQAKVDILFIVDDSGSMYSHQQNLSDNIDLFTKGLVQNRFIDYHIGVISTAEGANNYSGAGPGAGRLSGSNVKFVTRKTPDAEVELKNNILIGTSGDGYEKVFSPMKLALTEPNLSGWNQGFYRKDAFVAIVVITDAEDQSHQRNGQPRPAGDPLNMSPADAYEFLLSLKGFNKSKVAAYGVYIPDNVPYSQCAWDDGGMSHRRLDEFFSLSNAVTYSLCDVNYGDKLAGIGNDLVRRIARQVALNRRPKLDTIRVSYGTQVIEPDSTRGWVYSPVQNAIAFGRDVEWSEQPDGTEVEVYYEEQDPNL